MSRKGNGSMGRVTIEITVANNHDMHMAASGTLPVDQVRQARLEALVDTGAHYLVLPETVANALGCPKTKPALVRFADNRMEFRDVVEEVRVELLGRHGTFNAIVEPHRDDPIVGVLILEALDLLVDCTNQKVHPRDPDKIIAAMETEAVAEEEDRRERSTI